MTILKCPRCGSDEVSGGYVSCNKCSKEWHPDDTDEGEAIRAFVERIAKLRDFEPEEGETYDSATEECCLKEMRDLILEARKLCGMEK